MAPVVLRAVVLRTRPYSETSLWVRLYTRSHGKISGIAKGGRKGTDRLYAPLLEVELKGYPPRSAEEGLWNLARPEIDSDWRDLAARPDTMAYAFALLELCERTLHEAQPHESLYEALTLAIAALAGSKDGRGAGVLLWFLVRLVDELGYTIQYALCPRCQNPLVYPVGPFQADAGGVLCADCSRGSPQMPVLEWEALVNVATALTPPDMEMGPRIFDVWVSRILSHLELHSDRSLGLESLKLLNH